MESQLSVEVKVKVTYTITQELENKIISRLEIYDISSNY
ncbi:hypothetical protein NOS3756_05340 [Nostoc sp. NIES-3756]|nr:hypothetical protein NOS3756_05340 [Nostoc sp. NIES-3756]